MIISIVCYGAIIIAVSFAHMNNGINIGKGANVEAKFPLDVIFDVQGNGKVSLNGNDIVAMSKKNLDANVTKSASLTVILESERNKTCNYDLYFYDTKDEYVKLTDETGKIEFEMQTTINSIVVSKDYNDINHLGRTLITHGVIIVNNSRTQQIINIKGIFRNLNTPQNIHNGKKCFM